MVTGELATGGLGLFEKPSVSDPIIKAGLLIESGVAHPGLSSWSDETSGEERLQIVDEWAVLTR